MELLRNIYWKIHKLVLDGDGLVKYYQQHRIVSSSFFPKLISTSSWLGIKSTSTLVYFCVCVKLNNFSRNTKHDLVDAKCSFIPTPSLRVICVDAVYIKDEILLRA